MTELAIFHVSPDRLGLLYPRGRKGHHQLHPNSGCKKIPKLIIKHALESSLVVATRKFENGINNKVADH